jgi:hypothetical protein
MRCTPIAYRAPNRRVGRANAHAASRRDQVEPCRRCRVATQSWTGISWSRPPGRHRRVFPKFIAGRGSNTVRFTASRTRTCPKPTSGSFRWAALEVADYQPFTTVTVMWTPPGTVLPLRRRLNWSRSAFTGFRFPAEVIMFAALVAASRAVSPRHRGLLGTCRRAYVRCFDVSSGQSLGGIAGVWCRVTPYRGRRSGRPV